MTWKILKLFVNRLIADGKYSLLNRVNLTQHIEMHLSQNQKFFLNLFAAFLKFALNFEFFEKEMTLMANVFLSLQTPKNVVG